MIDDFKTPPERQPTRLDSAANLRGGSTADTGTPQEFSLAPQEFSRPAPESFHTPEVPSTDAPDPTTGDDSASSAPHEELLLPAHAGVAGRSGKTIRLFRRWDISRRKLIIISAAAVLVLVGGGAAFALTHGTTSAPKPVAKKVAPAPTPAPKPIVSALTGMPVTADKLARPVVGVMIENSPDARPQSGLADAGVVYEAIAEAGITRFLALFQEQDTASLGPVRSSRPYYLDWAMAFDAAYAHVGGSPDALQRIKDISVRDLDQFYNPAAYHRITSRYAPHNVYTSVPQLRDLAVSKGYDKSTFTSFPRKSEQPYKAPAPTPAPSPTPAPKSGAKSSTTTKKPAGDTRTPATAIDFGISGAYYNAHYDYDGASNSYKRSMGGAPHTDADSRAQLSPKVVMALVMPYSLMADGYHSQYATQGTGKAYLFQDGTVAIGTWTKGEPKSQFEFKEDNGKTMQLNPGQTWISIVADQSKVSYQ